MVAAVLLTTLVVGALILLLGCVGCTLDTSPLRGVVPVSEVRFFVVFDPTHDAGHCPRDRETRSDDLDRRECHELKRSPGACDGADAWPTLNAGGHANGAQPRRTSSGETWLCLETATASGPHHSGVR